MVDDIALLGLVDDGDLELDKAALQLAALDQGEAQLPACLELLARMEDRLAAQGKAELSSAEQSRRLARVISSEFGFEGDQETYDDPANGDLIRVIQRRRGLPVALSILYVALARRLGWTANALNTPGHVLVGLGPPPFCIIDPFRRGEWVAPEQLDRFFSSGAAAPVAAMTNRTVLVRLLMNLSTRAERAGQPIRALTVMQRITAVAPEFSFGWWERARLESALGDLGAARQSLSALLETTRDPELRAQTMSALKTLTG
jgi:regulator of sirC expression with transglutaminase-like and TPR domain